MKFKEFISKNGEKIIYLGNPNISILEELSLGTGDIWHSSLDEGFTDAFPELMYHSTVFFWYINDFHGIDRSVSWRLNPRKFAVRRSVWDRLNGFSKVYSSIDTQGLDFAFRAVYFSGAIPFYIKDLYAPGEEERIIIPVKDKYIFFRKNFKIGHSFYLFFRTGLFSPLDWASFFYALRNISKDRMHVLVEPRELEPIQGDPGVSYIIPTMMRQEYTLQLLEDLASQSYLPSQVIVVDATPEEERHDTLYFKKSYPFDLTVNWQTTKGSCRARNEAIALSKGDFIIFGDDDIRIPSNFVENHIKFLQTYKADACTGLDIRANHFSDGLDILDSKLKNLQESRKIAGVAHTFNNANSCVRQEYVRLLGGNDINFDGGYGEDSDFGLSLAKMGAIVLQNPFSANLHLKPTSGGYRFWGLQSKIKGKKRKIQPWELDTPVNWIIPVPSPTMMYGYLKHFQPKQISEYRFKYILSFLFLGKIWSFPLRFLFLPHKIIQFQKSRFYAEKLIKLGKRV